jgi:hypothetical protein
LSRIASRPHRDPGGDAPDLRFVDLLLPAGVGVLVLVLAVLSAKLKLSLSLTALAFVGTVSAVAALTSSLVFRLTARSTHHSLSATSSLPATAAFLRMTMSLLIEDRDLTEYEKTIECSKIWIVSPDLHKDVGPESFRDIVADNIRHRGIEYTWILNGSHPGIVATIRDLKSRYSEAERAKMHFILLPSDKWVCLPYTSGDFAVYNPTCEPATTETRLYYEYPDEKRELWIRVYSPVLEQWMDQLEAVVPELTK